MSSDMTSTGYQASIENFQSFVLADDTSINQGMTNATTQKGDMFIDQGDMSTYLKEVGKGRKSVGDTDKTQS